MTTSTVLGTWRDRRRFARCQRRLHHDAGAGRPVERDGRAHVEYRCVPCDVRWVRPVDTDIDVEDVVRADLGDGTVYGWVTAVEGDRITLLSDGTTHTADRWRVQVY
ncbi:hypothetical protein [Streptomyces avicenniae]|uniref:hypothetical protein n=1 Tax=Streptomyces avicenniae TaxID=500153 RepID=UPI00069BF166|nr:hypothetical protein [Streptomyces avicenniae]